MKTILAYLKYPSTWKGIVTVLTLVGIEVAPDQADAIAKGGVALVGAIWTLFSDKDVA